MRRLLTGLVILAALLAGADRLSAYLASRTVASQITSQAPQCRDAGVDIGGFPFLTQAVAGRYSDVTITMTCTATGSLTLEPLRVHLSGAHLGLAQILHRQVQRVPVDRLTAQATLPYAELDQQAAGQRLTFSPGPDSTLTVTGTLSIAGHSVSAHGTGQLSISAGQLRVAVDSVSTPVGTVSPGTTFDIALPIVALPFHLTSAAVSASATGVVIAASARDVVLQK